MSERVLVTGAAGFMGSHVAEHCLGLGMEVVAADNLSGGFIENVPEGCEWVEADMVDAAAVERLFDRGPFDAVYHLAAYAAEGLSHFIRNYNYRNNLIASANLLNQAVLHDVKCFVFTSSIAVYGRNQLPMNEDLVPMPEDPYGIAKYAVEQDLRAAHEMFGTRFVVFRPHNVYGERQNIKDRYRNVIGIFMNQLLQGEPMTIFGDGKQTRAFSHIDDVAPYIAAAPRTPESWGEVFNVGADTTYTILELAEAVARVLGVEPAIEHLPPRLEVVDAYCSHEKFRTVFDAEPRIGLDEGLRRMAAWVRAEGMHRPRIDFDHVEVARNLPPSWAAHLAPTVST